MGTRVYIGYVQPSPTPPPQNPHPPAPSSRALIPLCMQKMLSEVPGKVDVYKNTHVVFNFL